MKKKYGKFYADWRDERGVRRAKAFPTKKAALAFTARKHREVARKKAAAQRQPRRASNAGRRPTPRLRQWSRWR
jgi:hypothetical protein